MKTVVAGALGECVHVAGVTNFLQLAQQVGWRTVFLGLVVLDDYGVSVRGMESLIRLACIAHRTDYWQRGRTVESLGIGHLSVSELTRYVTGQTRHIAPPHTRHPKLSPISISRVEQSRKENISRLHEKIPLTTDASSYKETTIAKN